jgi:hypothetical protein
MKLTKHKPSNWYNAYEVESTCFPGAIQRSYRLFHNSLAKEPFWPRKYTPESSDYKAAEP